MMEERITLTSIAGYREEKEEARKLIDILKYFDLYKSQGASIPKGLLLCGEPGVGKTMFVKAIATEAGVPLYELEAAESNNEEEAVNRLKEQFARAKENIPSIVFIDELDELVSSTDPMGFYTFQSDYSRKTLKTLLTEIDGISSSDGILVIATASSKRTIPAALRRSGRLEKQITFNLPNAEDRLAIAELYLGKIDASHIDAKAVARKTEGFSGADIKSLINSSLIEAVRRKEKISLPIIVSMIPTIRFGEIKKASKDGPSDAVCYHEIGYFLTQFGLSKEIGSISVESYGDITGRMEIEDEFDSPIKPKREAQSADEILDSVAVCLGGIAGEEVFLGKRFCGSASDISKAIELINVVLANGALGFELLPSFDVNRPMGNRLARFSTPNKAGVDLRSEKILQILNDKLAKATGFCKTWRGLGERIFPILKEKEVLSKEELGTIVNGYLREGGAS